MRKYIRANWFVYDNFGDAITPFLLERLSGLRVKYCKSWKERVNYKKELKKILFSIRHFKCYNYHQLIGPDYKHPVILGVGSIMTHSSNNFLIWGSGFMAWNEKFRGGKVIALRGKYSAQKLIMEGYPATNIFGDPALLLPLVYKPVQSKIKYRCGIVPHLFDEKIIKEKYNDMYVISLRCNYNVASVIDKICQCEYILSTSLHGIIVAHAYGIPALWIKEGDICTDGLKFADYFSSVGIEEYDGSFEIKELIKKKYSQLPKEIKKYMLPKTDIAEIQRDLLNCAPFPILESIKNQVKI